MVESKRKKENFLGLYENGDGIIVNVKKIKMNGKEKEGIVGLWKIDDRYFLRGEGEKEESVVNIVWYKDKILRMCERRNGCSVCIGGGGIIWGRGFGGVRMGGGGGGSVVLLLMGEGVC